MLLIHGPLSQPNESGQLVSLKVDRLRLAKRRWRGFAEDGKEFGFDLEQPLRDCQQFFAADGTTYVVQQLQEPVIEIACSENPEAAARLGWALGNLHFPLEIGNGFLRVCDDPAVRQMLIREKIPHHFTASVFQPISGAHTHGG